MRSDVETILLGNQSKERELMAEVERLSAVITELTSEEHSVPELRQMLGEAFEEKQKCYFAVSQYEKANTNLLWERGQLRSELAAAQADVKRMQEFITGELDEFIPGWRDKLSEIARLRKRISEQDAALKLALEALRANDNWHLIHDEHNGYIESDLATTSLVAITAIQELTNANQ
jgi:chromosome segregation ATPase